MLDDAQYPQYFGFTEEETNHLLNRAGLSQKAHGLKEMYNGYNLEDYTLYNPFSIVSFTKQLLLKGEKRMQEALKPYWINTGGTHLIGELIKNRFVTSTCLSKFSHRDHSPSILKSENLIGDIAEIGSRHLFSKFVMRFRSHLDTPYNGYGIMKPKGIQCYHCQWWFCPVM